MTSCLLRIHSLRFFDGGLHEVPVEEVMTVALIAIFIFVWLHEWLLPLIGLLPQFSGNQGFHFPGNEGL